MKTELKGTVTLDELWSEALSLGRIEIEIDSDYDGIIYTVSIVPKLSSGRRVIKVAIPNRFIVATGYDSCIKFAMARAISKAKKMQA